MAIPKTTSIRKETKNYALTFCPEPDQDFVTVVVRADHVPTPEEILDRYVRNQNPWYLMGDRTERDMGGSLLDEVNWVVDSNAVFALEVRCLGRAHNPGLYTKPSNAYDNVSVEPSAAEARAELR